MFSTNTMTDTELQKHIFKNFEQVYTHSYTQEDKELALSKMQDTLHGLNRATTRQMRMVKSLAAQDPARAILELKRIGHEAHHMDQISHVLYPLAIISALAASTLAGIQAHKGRSLEFPATIALTSSMIAIATRKSKHVSAYPERPNFSQQKII